MLDILLEGVVALGPERQIYYCNDSFLEIFGLDHKLAITGRVIHDFIMFSEKNLFIMPDGTEGESGIMHYRTMKFETFQGKRGEVQVAIVPTREVFAKSKLWFAYFNKITPQLKVL